MSADRRGERARRGSGGAGEEFSAAEREVDEELRFHIEGRIDALVARGVPLAEARSRALAAFGDVERVRAAMTRVERTRVRRRRRREWFSGVRMDLRVGARRLVRAPVVSSAAVLTLALGIGASVGMFSVIDAVVLRPLPFPEPDRLVRVWPGRNPNVSMTRAVATDVASIESFTGIARWGLTLSGDGEAAQVSAEVVDAGFFDVFGVRPVVGRGFDDLETEPSRSDVAVLSHDVWRTRYGGDRSILGRRLRLEGYGHAGFEVIGVMPPGFRSTGEPADLWVPLQLEPGRDPVADSSWYVQEIVARVRPGVPIERVSAEVHAAVSRFRAAYPGLLDEEAAREAGAVRLIDGLVGDVRGPLWLMLGAVVLVLLIACANLANLQLARAAGRRRDLAVRVALGASGGRLAREQVAEGALLALAGGALGVLVARAALAALRVTQASGLPRVGDAGVDGRALAFALAATAGSVVLFALLPALRAAGVAPREGLHEGGRQNGPGRASQRVSRALVTGEIALSVVLVTMAALMLASFATLRSVDPGLDADDVLVARLAPSPQRYAGDRAAGLYRALEERIAALPGVTAVGSIQLEPFSQGNWRFPYLAEGHAPPAGAPLPMANFRAVTPGYFAATDVPLVAGRLLQPEDGPDAQRVLLVNRAMASALWPGENAVGREVRVFGSNPYRVVGVVGDVRQHALDRAPAPEMYVAHAQWVLASMAVLVEAPRATALAPAIREVVRTLDPDVPIAEMRPLAGFLDDSLARRRFFVSLLAAFAALALLLGGVGVYGVTAHMVASLLPEAGLRLALGASPAAVLRRTMSRGLAPAALGFALGFPGALAAARLLRGLLFEVSPVHAPTWIAVAAVLGAVALVATWLPARRAAKLDPLTVLRAD